MHIVKKYNNQRLTNKIQSNKIHTHSAIHTLIHTLTHPHTYSHTHTRTWLDDCTNRQTTRHGHDDNN